MFRKIILEAEMDNWLEMSKTEGEGKLKVWSDCQHFLGCSGFGIRPELEGLPQLGPLFGWANCPGNKVKT